MSALPAWYERLAECLRSRGLDLVRPFALSWWNADADPAWRLPDLGRGDAFGIVVGNSRALWPAFEAALHREPGLAEADDPLDQAYVAPIVKSALAATGLRHEVRFSPEPPPRRPAIQRIAHVAGLAHLGASFLSVHPEHGPWIALRAVATLDADPPAIVRPTLDHPCGSCEERCLPRLREAIAVTSEGLAPEAEPWRRWLAVRDACPVGRASRYGDEQIRYHYVKDREVLRRAARGGGVPARAAAGEATPGAAPGPIAAARRSPSR